MPTVMTREPNPHPQHTASDNQAPPLFLFSDVQSESKYSKDLRAKRQLGETLIYTDKLPLRELVLSSGHYQHTDLGAGS